jgi:hypothetical protein
MMEHMQSSWDEIDGEQSLGFDDFSLEGFRQDLLEELKKDELFYNAIPNGVYTGFKKNETVCAQNGIIALMGYPAKPPQSKINTFTYRSYELIYINHQGEPLLLNQKEVLDALAKHKMEERFVQKDIDDGKPEAIKQLSDSISCWLKSKAIQEETQEDGSIKQMAGPAAIDLINKIKPGSKEAIQQLKTDGKPADKFTKENFDLITWFIVS